MQAMLRQVWSSRLTIKPYNAQKTIVDINIDYVLDARWGWIPRDNDASIRPWSTRVQAAVRFNANGWRSKPR